MQVLVSDLLEYSRVGSKAQEPVSKPLSEFQVSRVGLPLLDLFPFSKGFRTVYSAVGGWTIGLESPRVTASSIGV